MRRAALLLTSLLLGMALAGCTGNDVGGEATATADASGTPGIPGASGTIVGQVLDEESLPVSGALVAVAGTDRNATTREDGRFELKAVPAGMQTLLVVAEGFANHTSEIEVVDGAVSEPTITLQAVAGAEPWVDVIPFAGRFECSMALVNVFWLPCLLNNTVQEAAFPESSNAFWFQKTADAGGLVAELHWEAGTAATGRELDFSIVGSPRENCQWYANAYGPSDLRLEVHVGQRYLDSSNPTPVGTCGDKVVDRVDNNLGILIYASPTYAQNTALVGITLQQNYNGFVSVFYHQEPTPDYTAFN